jgi:uncharacterized protein
MFELQIGPLEPGVHTFALHPSPDDLDLDADAFRDIAVDLRLDLSEGQAHVTLETRATASLICDRTLEPFEQVVEGTHDVFFTAAAAHAEAMGEKPSDDLLPLVPGQTTLDLTTATRDTIVLSVPVRCVAPGAEDAELPTSFGALTDDEGNAVDARWQALLDLKKNRT